MPRSEIIGSTNEESAAVWPGAVAASATAERPTTRQPWKGGSADGPGTRTSAFTDTGDVGKGMCVTGTCDSSTRRGHLHQDEAGQLNEPELGERSVSADAPRRW